MWKKIDRNHWKEPLCIIIAIYVIIKGFYYMFSNETTTSQIISGDIKNSRQLQGHKLIEQTQNNEQLTDADENSLLFRRPIDLAVIFANADNNIALQYNLKRTIASLMKYTSAPIRLHLISDDLGYEKALKIITDVQSIQKFDSKQLQVVLVSPSELKKEVEPTVSSLQKHFTRLANSKYRDFLFFFSLFLDKLFPELTNLILIDIDVEFSGDLGELNSYFLSFDEKQILGMSPELSTVYRHILSQYRRTHPETILGSSFSSGGFPGFNSGVLLVNVTRLKESQVIKHYFDVQTLANITDHYSFRGHLGDQDLYTLIAFDHPEIFYTLPCQWNRQLCIYWKDKGYTDVFDEYFQCKPPIKLWHGNCNSRIPDEMVDSTLTKCKKRDLEYLYKFRLFF